MSELDSNDNTQQSIYWQTLQEYAKDPEFEKLSSTEFASSPLREGSSVSGLERRDFLKLMGASIALASSACVRRPAQKIIPYAKQPEEITFGVSNYYTSNWFDGVEPVGLLVKTREGRPLKMEGLPKHPLNRGALMPRAQAHILSLYDPERLKGPKKNLLNEKRSNRDTINVSWDDADKAIVDQLKKGGVAILTGAVASPTGLQVIADFCQGFKARHFQWELVNHDDLRKGSKASYGEEAVPYYRFDLARLIVSVDADFLGTWLAPTAFTKQFSQGRRDPQTMSRLVVFDSNYSLTGANADIRYRISPSQQLSVVMGLAHELIVKQGKTRFAGVSAIRSQLEPFAQAESQIGMPAHKMKELAENLWAHRGKSLVVAGGLPTQTEQGLALQIAVNFLNSALENEGTTVLKNGFSFHQASHQKLMELKQAMEKGEIKTLIVNKANPLFAAPAQLQFAEAMKKVEMVISTADQLNETAQSAHFVLPESHSLESWGDLHFADGLVGIQQPTIRALHDTRSFGLSLMTWAFMANVGPERIRKFETYYDYLRNYWKESIHPKFGKGQAFEEFWDGVLETGFAGSLANSGARSFQVQALNSVQAKTSTAELELVLHPSVQMGDGTLANVAWLQELPDPVSKIVWDNHVSLSMRTADRLKLKEGDVVLVKVNGLSIEIPVHIQPGLHDKVAAIAVGYGRAAAGKVGNNVGSNAAPLIAVQGGGFVFSGSAVTLEKTKKNIPLATVAGHSVMSGPAEGNRKIVAETTLDSYLADPHSGNHRHKIFSLWSGHQYNGPKWGMAVDLNSCTGCSACMVACQSENNIPVVGKKYVLQNREMHWMRVDRYFVGAPEDAKTVFQPVMCQHCDNAPCETVCPVLATVHSSDGLNDMVYNRCVGTRYCANNCPYKVRRFNWFHFTKNIEQPLHLALNPDVTLRPRGVMEKCTFCVQRIKAGKNKARVEKRAIVDGDIKTACQQTCPADAITFGDLNDPNSAVAKIFKDEPRAYGLLEEFNAAPAVRYLTKIRNNGEKAAHSSSEGHA